MSLRRFVFGMVILAAAGSAADTNVKSSVTYSKEVAPILFKNCVTCHRSGEIGPMSLLSYQEARPWAKAIKQAVQTKKMPPWYADPNYGHFKNDTRLAQGDIDAIVKWADGGAPEGNKADMPPTPKFTEGWVLGKPDAVVEMPEAFDVPAEGVIPYKYFTAKTNFGEDKWVRGIEIRPGNRGVVHHIILNMKEPGTNARAMQGLGGTAPGLQATFYPEGVARLVKSGSEIIFQMHYTPNGKATTDKSYVGLYFAKEPPKEQMLGHMIANFSFKIPPGDPNYEVRSTWTVPDDVTIRSMMPHMHLRGKDFKYTAYYPDGREEVLLNVPRYDFEWQLGYQPAETIHLPKGTRVECVAHFDNSLNNKFNPDPAKEVRWGDQTFEEMMIGFFDYSPEKKQQASADR
jgi:hypothetical protein